MISLAARLAVLVLFLSNTITYAGTLRPVVLLNTPQGDTQEFYGISSDMDSSRILIGNPINDRETNRTLVSELYDIQGNLLQTFTAPSDENFINFGDDVALGHNYSLIGSSGTNDHAAYVFDNASGNLIKTLKSSVPNTHAFGNAVATHGNHALVGAASSTDSNGNSVGRVFRFDATTGELLHTFEDPTPETPDDFGSTITVDGNLALIGSYAGEAHLFDLNNNAYLHTFTGGNGFSVALHGDHVLIGGNFGTLIHYDTSGQFKHYITFPAYDVNSFGSNLAVNDQYIVVGISDYEVSSAKTGRVLIFDTNTAELLHTIDNPVSGTAADEFGANLTLHNHQLLISAPRTGPNGMVFLYDIPEPASLALLTLAAPLLLRRRSA